MLTISSPAANDIKGDKLPLEMEPVARNSNTSKMLKPGYQTFIIPFSTDNQSINGKYQDPFNTIDRTEIRS